MRLIFLNLRLIAVLTHNLFVTFFDLFVFHLLLANKRGCKNIITYTPTLGDLDKIDQTLFLDQTDYLIGKLPDQTEVSKIKTRIRPDSKTHQDQHITFICKWQTIALLFTPTCHQ